MCRLYQIMQWFARRWLFIVLLLIVATFGFGMVGLAQAEPKNSVATNLYLVVQMFGLGCTEVTKNVGLELEITRWLGFAVWSSTIAAVVIRLFSQGWLVFFVAVCTRFRQGHVVVAGLGDAESERDLLVEQMRQRGQDVVVIEPDADHPGLDACRQAGAICLIGSPLEPMMLRKARVARAGTLLALCEDDRKNITLLTLVAAQVGGKAAPPPESGVEEDPLTPTGPNDIGCVVQVSEPRLLEVLRHHNLHRNPADRLHVRIFNMHELVARAMLRESLVGLNTPRLDRVLLVGTGAAGRLGTTLVLRALKDRWIDRVLGKPITPMEIHVFDEKATAWSACMRSEMGEELAALCRLHPYDLPGARHGYREPEMRKRLEEAQVDVAFICLSNESLALIQAATLREILRDTVHIIVRVKEEDAGFGALLQPPAAGGLGSFIRPVGTHD